MVKQFEAMPKAAAAALILAGSLLWASGCATVHVAPLTVSSPDGSISIAFALRGGAPFYSVSRNGVAVVKSSKLGFVFKDQGSLNNDLRIRRVVPSRFDEEWEQPWGEVQTIRNHYTSYPQVGLPLHRLDGTVCGCVLVRVLQVVERSWVVLLVVPRYCAIVVDAPASRLAVDRVGECLDRLAVSS